MKNTAYIIKNRQVIACINDECSIPAGTTVEFSKQRCKENINADRKWNLVNSQTGKISKSKKWGKFQSELAAEINPGEFYI